MALQSDTHSEWFEGELIPTKLTVPALRLNRVVRERLIQIVHEAPVGSVTALVSPAGYGKTTLLAEWALRAEGPVAWLTLSEADNDLVRFWQYLTSALKTAMPTVSTATLRRMSLMRRPPFETPLNPLIGEISQYNEPVNLFLDDFHIVLDPVVLQSVATFLEAAPPNLRVFLASRTSLAGAIAKASKIRGFKELRTRDLAFSRQESSDFFEWTFRGTASLDTTELLLRKTDGWVAGLQIAAFGLREANDPKGYAKSFSGQHRHLLDFFKDEVFVGILPAVRDFIVKTSILDRFNADLCDALMLRTDSARVLQDLAQSDMFIVPLDEKGTWYRYQGLFRDVALQSLENAFADEVPALHRRASEWFEQHNLLEEATNQSLRAGDWQRVVSLIEPIASRLTFTNKLGMLASWILRLPVESLGGAPYLSLLLAHAMIVANLRTDLEPYFEIAERVAKERSDPRLMAAALSIRSLRVGYRGSMSEAVVFAKRALKILPAEERVYRSVCTRILGVVDLVEEHPVPAAERCTESIRLALECSAHYTTCASMAVLALTYERRGLIPTGLELIQEAERYCADNLDLTIVHIPIIRAKLLYAAWRIDEAISTMENFDELCLETGHLVFSASSHYLRAQLHWAKGNAEEMERHLELARTQTLNFGSIHELFSTQTIVPRLRLADSRWDSAEVWERSESLEPLSRANYARDSLLARIRFWRDANSENAEGAEYHLDQLQQLGQGARRDGRGGDLVDSWVGLATGQFYLGNAEAALNSLASAISVAEPEGFLRPFFEEGHRIRPVLETARSRGMFLEFLDLLGSGPAEPISTNEPVVALSEREIEILRLVSLGYQNDEIAMRVMLSENTIKTHLRNIFSKLGIRNRTQAVARGRELNLVG